MTYILTLSQMVEMPSGYFNFEGYFTTGVLYNAMLAAQHPSVTIASGRRSRIIRECTAVKPDKRYQSAIKLRSAL